MGGLLLALALTGCGDDTGADWPSGGPSIDPRGLVWATGSTVHLGDGSTIDTGFPIDAYVVAPTGVYAVAEPPADDDSGVRFAELQRVTPDGTEPTGAHPEPTTLTVSPDGTHLAFIDRSGKADGFGTPLAEAVVVDLASGKEILRSADGMGDTDSDDLTDLYEELPPEILGISATRAYVITTDDVRSVDLDSGDVEVVGEDTGDVNEEPWYDALQRDLIADNPNGQWSIRPQQGAAPQLVGTADTVVETRLSAADVGISGLDPQPKGLSWTLDSWLDDTTAVGTARVSSSLDGSETQVLITCTVPDGGCRAVPGTEGGALVPEDRRDDVLVPDPRARP